MPTSLPMPRRRVMGAALLTAVLMPRLARAHAILEQSQPPARGTVSAGTLALHLWFNSRIDRPRSRLTLIRPDKSRVDLAIGPDGSPNQLNATAQVAPGAHVLRWQVLAIDGHITRGELPFTVTGI